MMAGRIKCDFCDFIGEMPAHAYNSATLKIPDSWISIHPMIVVHGMRGLKSNSPEYERREAIKEKIKEKVAIIHCCPACATDRNVFDLQIALPQPAQQARENYMRADQK